MKQFFTILAAMWALSSMRAEEYPIPEMPNQIVLTSGRILTKVQVLRWEKDRVLIRWAGGREPIPYTIFKIPSQSEVLRMYRGIEDYVGKLSGQVFITTKGAGSYKFASTQVTLRMLDKNGKQLPDDPISSVTDADGKFEIQKPVAGSFVIHCFATRKVNGASEFYHWELKARNIRDPKNVVLNDYNIVTSTE